MINQSGMKRLERLVRNLVEEGARTGAAFTKEAVSGSGHGDQYDELPNRSAMPGEYPAKQSGTLASKIKMRKVSATEAAYGAINPTQEIVNLEFFPASMGGSKWLSRTAHDPENHKRIIDAIGKKV